MDAQVFYKAVREGNSKQAVAMPEKFPELVSAENPGDQWDEISPLHAAGADPALIDAKRKTAWDHAAEYKSLSHNRFERRVFLFCREVLG